MSGSDFAGKWLVLGFYPREEFLQEDCMILGVSPDSTESHRKFRELKSPG